MFSVVYNAKHRQCCTIRFLKIKYYNIKLLEGSNKLNTQLHIVTLCGDIFTDADYSQSPSMVTLPGGETNVSIPVSTKGDDVIEDHESFVVVAFPPSQNNLNCSTKVVILDDSK